MGLIRVLDVNQKTLDLLAPGQGAVRYNLRGFAMTCAPLRAGTAWISNRARLAYAQGHQPDLHGAPLNVQIGSRMPAMKDFAWVLVAIRISPRVKKAEGISTISARTMS